MLDLDANGNVAEFQTYEANSTDNGSIMLWWKPGSADYTIGLPFRSTDTVGERTFISTTKCQV